MKKTSIVLNVILAVLAGVLLFKVANTEEPQGNAAYDNIMTRCSVRAYDSERTVPDEIIEKILRAGMAAPTAVNKQPWAFVVIKKPELLKELADSLPNAKMTANASFAIVVCGDMDKALEGVARDFWIQDASAATENILLAVNSLGLGAVWTGIYPNMERANVVSNILNAPKNIIPLCLIPVGYPAEEKNIKDKWKPENIHYDGWN